MRLIRTLKKPPIFLWLFSFLWLGNASGQVCSSPATIVYGMDNNGFIYPITTATGAVGPRINPPYPGNSVSSPNAMGYNSSSGLFYFFKRNADQTPEEFVSFNPTTNTYTVLGNCPSTVNIKTGCVNSTGSGYYCIDANAVLYFYRFTSGMWRQIANNFIDQFGTNVTATLAVHSSGDIAMDGIGNIWFLCSDATTYGLYKFEGPIPTTTVGTMNIRRRIVPTTPTPTGNSFAGIAFNPTGQILISQYGDDRLYRLNNNNTLTLMGTTSTSGVGTDLTSCNYPMTALANNWQSFTVEAKSDQQTQLTWTVLNENEKGYFIEFSNDAENWKTLGFVEAINNETGQAKYSFTSSASTNGRNYYRIRQVGHDGEYSYSEVKFIDIKTNNLVSFGPNPTKGNIQVKNNMNTSSRIYVFDLAGQMVKESSLARGLNTINISHFPPGTYLLRVLAENGLTYNQKIIKE